MNKAVGIEDIEEMSRLVGIDDVEFREAIRGLRIGDLFKITLPSAVTPPARETVLVRLTGARVVFREAHIHSVAKGRLTHAR
jgi:hypothetical protein